jgi:transcriptional regulator with XRE-family HTH domain
MDPSAEFLKKMANTLDVSTDFLMDGTTADLATENITDKTLINQFNRISELSEENKTMSLNLLMFCSSWNEAKSFRAKKGCRLLERGYILLVIAP